MESEESQTELDLLLAITCYGESEDQGEQRTAEAAFVTLMNRHDDSLNSYIGASVKEYSTFRFDHEEMYSRLGEKIWRNAEQFDPDSEDPSVISPKFLAWASRIRNNLFNDAVSAVRIDLDFKDFDEIRDLLPKANPHSIELSPAAETLAEAIQTLSERDQDILRSLAVSAPLDGKQLKTKSEDLKFLAKHLGVTVPSLTTMRKRAIDRLKKAIEELAALK